jgi:hypothetical protein
LSQLILPRVWDATGLYHRDLASRDLVLLACNAEWKFSRVSAHRPQPTYTTDTNTEGLFGTLTIDGYTYYVGQIVQSSIPIPGWSPVLGVQRQLDMPPLSTTQTINEYVDQETVYTW